MSLPVWREVELSTLAVDAGWRYDEPVLVEKMATSLRRHGQLRAIVVWAAPDGTTRVADGRLLLRAMLALGWTRAMVADVGDVGAEAARRLALDLELRAETDYAALAQAVAGMLEAGATAAQLAAASPFTAERLGYMPTLATFDWGQYAEAPPDAQVAFGWGEPPLPELAEALAEVLAAAPAPVPPPAGLPEGDLAPWEGELSVAPVEAPTSIPAREWVPAWVSAPPRAKALQPSLLDLLGG